MTSDVRKKNTIKQNAKTKNSPNSYVIFGYEPYTEKDKNEKYMCENQRNYFRKLLEFWRDQLRQGADHTLNEMKDSINKDLADPSDRATQEETFSLELRARDRERKLLKKIDEAIKQIDDQEYGYCEACGIEIGIHRLEARPTASLCFDCKSLAEIKEKRNN